MHQGKGGINMYVPVYVDIVKYAIRFMKIDRKFFLFLLIDL